MEHKAYKIGDEPLSGASQSFMQNALPNDLVDIVRLFMQETARAGFNSDETAIILNGYLKMGKESPLYYLEEMEVRELFSFLGTLKWTGLWKDDDVEKFQMMIMTDPAKEGILEVFKNHEMYKRIDSAGSAEILQPTSQFKNTYYLDSGGVRKLLTGDLKLTKDAYGERVSTVLDYADYNLTSSTGSNGTGGNDNNKPLESDPEESHEENLFDGFEDPYFVHPVIVSDQNDLENVSMKIGYDGMTYVFSLDTPPNSNIDLGVMFNYLRAFRVDAKCTMVLTIGGLDIPNSWCKRIPAKPGVWINFAELLLPYNDLYFPVRLRLVPKEVDELDDVNLQIMGVLLKSEAHSEFCTQLTTRPTNPYNYGFRRYFTLIQ